ERSQTRWTRDWNSDVCSSDLHQAAELKQAAERGTADLQNSLQQERDRASKLEQDLAAARRDVETQTALAVKAGEEAAQLKQVAKSEERREGQACRQEHAKAEA